MEHADASLVWLYAKITHFNNGAAPTFSILFNNRLCPSQYRYLIEKNDRQKVHLSLENYGLKWIIVYF